MASTSLRQDGRSGGAQRPRVMSVPASVGSAGVEALDLCRMAGLVLDPWQELVLSSSLGERPDGKWAAFEVGLVVSRQNGKGSLLEARELAGLFLLGERLIIHSAHQFDTSLEAFRRLLFLIEDNPDFDRRVKRVSKSHGEEGVELLNGQRIRFRTRTKGGGRGFTADCLILDEAMDMPEFTHGALMPTLSARPNPQVWYTASAVDQLFHDNGVVLARIRERGLRGDDDSLAYFEWSVDAPHPDEPVDHKDPELWAQANPALGIRISEEHVANEQRSMDPRTFAVERLGIGDWPRTDGGVGTIISPEAWQALEDSGSQATGDLVFGFDVSADRSRTAIVVAGVRDDGLFHVEVVDQRKGTGWVADRIAELNARHHPKKWVCDNIGPAASLVPEIEHAGVQVVKATTQEYAQACGLLFDAVENQTLRHLGTPELGSAVKGATTRPLGDQWAWSRKNSTVDISPLVAATLAVWGLSQPFEEPWVGW